MSDARPIVVWSEIPVTDLDRAAKFYADVFDWKMQVDTSGPNPMATFDSRMDIAGGHLYPGTPGQGPTVHFALPDKLEAGMDRCTAAGGKVLGDPIPLPDGRFVYAEDPDGNSIGLYEATQ